MLICAIGILNVIIIIIIIIIIIMEFLCRFLQGLTGGDGHQQRTDYVLSTNATPGRYKGTISLLHFCALELETKSYSHPIN